MTIRRPRLSAKKCGSREIDNALRTTRSTSREQPGGSASLLARRSLGEGGRKRWQNNRLRQTVAAGSPRDESVRLADVSPAFPRSQPRKLSGLPLQEFRSSHKWTSGGAPLLVGRAGSPLPAANEVRRTNHGRKECRASLAKQRRRPVVRTIDPHPIFRAFA
jgi:hypothetical protein